MSWRPFTLWLILLLLGALFKPALAATAHLALQIELDPGTRRLSAQAELTPEQPVFNFALHETLEVTAASVNGKRLGVIDMGRDGALRRWRVALPAGNKGQLKLEYGGTLPALNRSLDQRGVLRSLPPMASEEGSFLPGGGAWYPHLGMHFTFVVSVSLPAGQRAIVPGRLVSEEVSSDPAGRYRASFEFMQPADGIDLMAGPWKVRERSFAREGGEPVKLRTYFTPELDATPGLADAYLDDTWRYLELYSGQIGAYPFTEFSIVASPLPTGFGMPTLTYMGAEVLKLPFIRASSLGHEVLHNWWGNGVYVDYASGNWSEGLTTFMADYAYKERESMEAARQMRLGWLRDFAAVPQSSLEPLTAFRSRTHGAAAALGYGKSAMLFVMLRDTIGSDAFASALRHFWTRHQFETATWVDLQRAFEQASGQSLQHFFGQWLSRADAPAVCVTRASAVEQGGQMRLSVALKQVQSGPPYALRLPVEIAYADHSETRWIESAKVLEEAALLIYAQPTGVRIDPELRIWRRLESSELPPILRQWIIATSPGLLIASIEADVREAAQALSRRLLEAPAHPIALNELKQATEPVLLIGLHGEVDAALARVNLPPRPASLGGIGKGSAQVWTVAQSGAAPLAVISANDTAALRGLLRPLPHYGAQSWLVFEGSRLLDRGVWAAPAPLVPVQ